MKVMLFDGSMEELLMAVYHVYVDKAEPILYREKDYERNLIDEPYSLSFDEEAFDRVKSSMTVKFAEETLSIISYALNHSDPTAPGLVLKYIISCFSNPRNAHNYQDDLIMKVTKLSRQVSLESHRFTGFIRFSLVGSVYMAKIDPDHDILSFVAPHFAERYKDMNYIIYDEKRHEAVVSQNGQWSVKKNIQLDEKLLKEDPTIEKWQQYFTHISISSRLNPKAQKRSMPVRYWKNLPETKETII